MFTLLVCFCIQITVDLPPLLLLLPLLLHALNASQNVHRTCEHVYVRLERCERTSSGNHLKLLPDQSRNQCTSSWLICLTSSRLMKKVLQINTLLFSVYYRPRIPINLNSFIRFPRLFFWWRYKNTTKVDLFPKLEWFSPSKIDYQLFFWISTHSRRQIT